MEQKEKIQTLMELKLNTEKNRKKGTEEREKFKGPKNRT
jgi:hypothetical protein